MYCVINGGLVILSREETQLALVLKEHSCKIRHCCCHRPLELPHLTHGVEGCPSAGGRHTVNLRPSEMTLLSTLLFAELFVHLPPDVINIVSGYGKDCGGPLVLNPWVCMIAFTGSLAMGQRIAQLVTPWTSSARPNMPTGTSRMVPSRGGTHMGRSNCVKLFPWVYHINTGIFNHKGTS